MKKKFVLIVLGSLLFVVAIFVIRSFFQGKGFVPIENYQESSADNAYPNNSLDMNKFYQNQYNMRAYKSDFNKSMSGIDVSVHQGNIDWKEVKNTGVEFVMIRLGYSDHNTGEIKEDINFKKNLEGAKKVDLKVGVYFFSQATNVDEAMKEGNFVLKSIYNKGIEMPVAFDMEPVTDSGRISSLTREEKTKIADCFSFIIKEGGYIPIIYGNPYWIQNNLNLNKLSKYNLWLAHYAGATDFTKAFAMWQYSETGKIGGIEGNTDLNIYFPWIIQKN